MNSSLETNGKGPASSVSDALQRDGEPRPRCAACRVEIVDNKWFCRLPQSRNGNGNGHFEGLTLFLCSPRCAMRYFSSSDTTDRGLDSGNGRYERTFQLLIDGRRPA